jgi:uncharacterized protein
MRNIDDEVSNTSNNQTFQEVVDARMSRRRFLGSGLTTAAAFSLGGVSALLKAVPVSADAIAGPLVRFQGIPVSDADTVVVPQGYTAEVLIAWGDPVSKGPKFMQDASNSAEDQARQWGFNNDGLVYFPIAGSRHGLLVENNEYADDGLLFPDGIANWNAEKTKKSMNAHGVSIIETRKGRDRHDDDHRRWRSPWFSKDSEWRVVRPSKYARAGLRPRPRLGSAVLRPVISGCAPAMTLRASWCSAH